MREDYTVTPVTIRERLIRRKKQIEQELDAVSKALDLLNKYPDFEAVHDAVTKAGY